MTDLLAMVGPPSAGATPRSDAAPSAEDIASFADAAVEAAMTSDASTEEPEAESEMADLQVPGTELVGVDTLIGPAAAIDPATGAAGHNQSPPAVAVDTDVPVDDAVNGDDAVNDEAVIGDEAVGASEVGDSAVADQSHLANAEASASVADDASPAAERQHAVPPAAVPDAAMTGVASEAAGRANHDPADPGAGHRLDDAPTGVEPEPTAIPAAGPAIGAAAVEAHESRVVAGSTVELGAHDTAPHARAGSSPQGTDSTPDLDDIDTSSDPVVASTDPAISAKPAPISPVPAAGMVVAAAAPNPQPITSTHPPADPAAVELAVPAELADAVTRQVAEALADVRPFRDGTQRLVVRLHPEDLGTVELDVRLRDGALHVRAATESEIARAVLEDGVAALRDRLDEAGIESGSIDVDARDTGADDQTHADPAPRPPTERGDGESVRAGSPAPDESTPDGIDPATGRIDVRL